MRCLSAALVIALHFTEGVVGVKWGSIAKTKLGLYQGTAEGNGVTHWLGMHYAEAPVGALRFAAPVPWRPFDGLFHANNTGPSCNGNPDPNHPDTDNRHEDCLTLDVYAPSDATPDSKLPVYVWIQGGGLVVNGGKFNGSALILASDKKMVTVAMGYRVGAFGFLASKEIQAPGSNATLNAGFLDQRESLKWVQDNIAAFGGDPQHVTIGGQSAGAGSIVSHLVAYNGDHSYKSGSLFHAANAESPSAPAIRSVAEQQFMYDGLVANTSCNGHADTLACLRDLDYGDVLRASSRHPFPEGPGGLPVYYWNPTIDGSFVPDLPLKLFREGKFAKVPTIFGGNTNEGYTFADRSIRTQEASEDFLRDTFPAMNATVLARYSALYNFTDAQGSPSYWQKAANAYGETRYNWPGIQAASAMAAHGFREAFVWHYDINRGLDGVYHGAEQDAIYSTDAARIIPAFRSYFLSFVQHYDPNAARLGGAASWDRWTLDGRGMMYVGAGANGSVVKMEKQDGLAEAKCRFVNSIAIDIRQ